MADIVCKHCNSENIVKYGKYKDVQYFWCKDCKRKFADNDALPKMRTSTREIADAIQSFYDGMSINGIRRNLKQQYGHYPSESTVYEWITKYTKDAISRTEQYKPNVGYVWLADETMIDIDGKKHWLWDIIDLKTRYLLASHISTKRNTDDAIILMHKATLKADKFPKVVMTDSLAAYLDAIQVYFGGKAKHLKVKKFTVQPNNNVIERMHGIIKDRLKVMRGLKRYDTAKLILEGFLVHYNYFRPHESLETKEDRYITPAEKAGIDYPFEDWLQYLELNKNRKVEGIEYIPIPSDRLPSAEVALQRERWRVNQWRHRVGKSKKYKKRKIDTSLPKITTVK